MITSCIDMIYNEEESWEATDCSKKELDEFVDQLNTVSSLSKLRSFSPQCQNCPHLITVKNPNTGVESEVVLEGLASFFS